jgi:uncharacterized protein (TIGR02452 family)
MKGTTMSLKTVAQEVLTILDSGVYFANGEMVRIDSLQKQALDSTRLYAPKELEVLRNESASGVQTRVSIIDGTTQFIAHQMSFQNAEPFALLNFASARNPGGGFLNGAKAQEEDVCRCSGLYQCLSRCMEYYDANRAQESLLYTDYAIYSCGVPFFRIRSTGDFLRQPFVASVISAPAPNSAPYLKLNPGKLDILTSTFLRRWENALCIARANGVHRLLLGAWGCGAFGGDPQMAATTAKQAIARFGSAFDEIVFAIPSAGKESLSNLNVFRTVFSE